MRAILGAKAILPIGNRAAHCLGHERRWRVWAVCLHDSAEIVGYPANNRALSRPFWLPSKMPRVCPIMFQVERLLIEAPPRERSASRLHSQQTAEVSNSTTPDQALLVVPNRRASQSLKRCLRLMRPSRSPEIRFHLSMRWRDRCWPSAFCTRPSLANFASNALRSLGKRH